MIEKEKAEEIFNKMYDVTDDFGLRPMYHETAKKCALIAVDEIINILPFDDLRYWGEIKQEIEKL